MAEILGLPINCICWWIFLQLVVGCKVESFHKPFYWHIFLNEQNFHFLFTITSLLSKREFVWDTYKLWCNFSLTYKYFVPWEKSVGSRFYQVSWLQPSAPNLIQFIILLKHKSINRISEKYLQLLNLHNFVNVSKYNAVYNEAVVKAML